MYCFPVHLFPLIMLGYLWWFLYVLRKSNRHVLENSCIISCFVVTCCCCPFALLHLWLAKLVVNSWILLFYPLKNEPKVTFLFTKIASKTVHLFPSRIAQLWKFCFFFVAFFFFLLSICVSFRHSSPFFLFLTFASFLIH